MQLKSELKVKLVNIYFSWLLLSISISLCDSDVQHARQKRTIGVFFRSFVEAFQPQRQPAPMVVSYQPLRPALQAQHQSTKADLFASSKNIFQQKKNAFKPSTKSPDVEVITPTASPPVLPPPSTDSLPLGYGHPQSPPNPGPTSSLNPFAGFVPPPGHHPLAPVKAQILILPFQGQQQGSFGGFGAPEPRLPTPATFNYQAEIYLHPPGGGMYPAVDHYPARYSHSSGWKDVDEIFSRVKGPSRKEAVKTDAKQGKAELTTYNTNFKSPDSAKYTEQTTPSSLPVSNQSGPRENDIDGQRRDSDHQRHNGHQLLNYPLFIPNPPHNGFFNLESFGNTQGAPLHGSFLVSPFSSHHRFETPIDDGYHKHIPEGLQTKQEHDGQNGVVNGAVQNIHDFIPQRQASKEHSEEEEKHSQEYSQGYHKNEGAPSQNLLYYPEQQPYQAYHLDKSPYENQFIGKVGHLPDSMLEYQYHEQSPGHNPHQPPPIHDSLLDRSDHSEHPVEATYYIKRSNSEENNKNCNKCRSG